MSLPPISLEHLEVVGYADSLPDGRGPEIVPPVFRDRRESDRFWVPPFRLANDWLVNPHAVTRGELDDFAAEGRVTLLPGDLVQAASAGWLLWVDAEGATRYEPGEKVRDQLRSLGTQRLARGTAALRAARVGAAMRDAEVAMAALPQAIEPRALLAACHAFRGEAAEVTFLRQAAVDSGHDTVAFDAIIARYSTREFSFTGEVGQFLLPTLNAAEFSFADSAMQVKCRGSDALFLDEFLRLFRENELEAFSAGVAVEVVRKAFWSSKPKGVREASADADSLEDYFGRLFRVLIERGPLGFVKMHGLLAS